MRRPLLKFMLTGKRITLKKHALGLESVDGENRPVLIPTGASVEFTSEPTYGNGLANVHWDTHEAAIFLSSIGQDDQELLALEVFRW